MSHANTNVIYPQSTDRDLSCWQVREDGDDYGKDRNSEVRTVSLLDLHDRVIDRLSRAKALTRLLKSADTESDGAIQVTAIVLEEHIEQAQTTSERMWGYIQRERRGN